MNSIAPVAFSKDKTIWKNKLNNDKSLKEAYIKVVNDYNLFINNDLIEENILTILKNKFDNTLERTKDKYDRYDFISDKYLIELKSRKFNMNKYNTTIITKHKIIKTHKVLMFVFNFDDYLTYYIYNEEDIKTNKCYFKLGGRTDRGFIETYNLLNIPINLLTIINQKQF